MEKEGILQKFDQVIDSCQLEDGSYLYKVQWFNFSWIPEECLNPSLVSSYKTAKEKGASSNVEFQQKELLESLTSKLECIQELIESRQRNKMEITALLDNMYATEEMHLKKEETNLAVMKDILRELHNLSNSASRGHKRNSLQRKTDFQVTSLKPKLKTLKDYVHEPKQINQNSNTASEMCDSISSAKELINESTVSPEPVSSQTKCYSSLEIEKYSKVSSSKIDSLSSNAGCNVSDALNKLDKFTAVRKRKSSLLNSALDSPTKQQKARSATLDNPAKFQKVSPTLPKKGELISDGCNQEFTSEEKEFIIMILYFPGCIVNLSSVLENNERDMEEMDIEVLLRVAQKLAPRCGKLVSSGNSSELDYDLFVKKTPKQFVNIFDLNKVTYIESFNAPIHESISPDMLDSLRKINSMLHKAKPHQICSVLNEADDLIKNGILFCPGPVVNARTLRHNVKKIDKGLDAELFAQYAQLLSPTFGQVVAYRYGGRSPILKCFIKKPPGELVDVDIDIARYSRRYFMPIHMSITTGMQEALRSIGFLTESMIDQSELQSRSKEAILDMILHGQGPVVNAQTFMDKITNAEFLSNVQLLSPKHGKVVSYFCKGSSFVQKCFVKKHPSHLTQTPGLDIERYSQRFFAPIHSSLTEEMQASLRELGYLSNQFAIEITPGPNLQYSVVKVEGIDTDSPVEHDFEEGSSWCEEENSFAGSSQEQENLSSNHSVQNENDLCTENEESSLS